MRQILLFAGCFFLCFAMAQAQKDPAMKQEKKALRLQRRAQSLRYLVFAYGAGYNQTRAPLMADINYKGPGAVISFGYWNPGPKGLWDVTFASGRYDYLLPVHKESYVHNGRYDGEMLYLRDLKSFSGGKGMWRLGGHFGLTYNFRYNPFLSNSSVHWDGIASLGLASSLTRSLRFFKSDWQLHYKLALPLFAYFNQMPTYRLPGFDGPTDFWVPIGKYTRVISEVSLEKRLGKHTANRYRISYRWDFYAFNGSEVQKLRVAAHSLTFALLFKL